MKLLYQFLYDVAKGDVEDKNYCKKCKYESKWCKHRKEREVAKQTLGAAITTYIKLCIINDYVALNNTDGENHMIT